MRRLLLIPLMITAVLFLPVFVLLAAGMSISDYGKKKESKDFTKIKPRYRYCKNCKKLTDGLKRCSHCNFKLKNESD